MAVKAVVVLVGSAPSQSLCKNANHPEPNNSIRHLHPRQSSLAPGYIADGELLALCGQPCYEGAQVRNRCHLHGSFAAPYPPDAELPWAGDHPPPHPYAMSPLQFARGALTLLLAPLLTLLVSLFSIIDLLWGRRSERKVQVFPRFWGQMLCRLAGVQVRIEGLEQITPEQTYIFAGNHVSQYDIFSFQGYFPHDFRWIAKKELFRIPVFGQAMRRIGYIPIDRSHGRQALKSLDAAARRIAAGSSVLIFPDGTRSADGQ